MKKIIITFSVITLISINSSLYGQQVGIRAGLNMSTMYRSLALSGRQDDNFKFRPGVNVPVSVCGMDVAPGEIIHMDENGACKFPADKLEAVLMNARALRAEEEDRIGRLQKAKSAAELRAIFGGHSYAAEKEKK